MNSDYVYMNETKVCGIQFSKQDCQQIKQFRTDLERTLGVRISLAQAVMYLIRKQSHGNSSK